MQGAPSILTNITQTQYTTDSADSTARTLRAKVVVQQIPVWEQQYQFSVPNINRNRGWISSDIPTVPGPTYAYPVMAPPVQYLNKSYSKLVKNAANQTIVNNRPAANVGAPPISTTYGG